MYWKGYFMEKKKERGRQEEHKRSTSGASQQEKHLKSGVVSTDVGVGGLKGVTGESGEGKEGEAGGCERTAGLRLMHCDSHLEGFHFP